MIKSIEKLVRKGIIYEPKLTGYTVCYMIGMVMSSLVTIGFVKIITICLESYISVKSLPKVIFVVGMFFCATVLSRTLFIYSDSKADHFIMRIRMKLMNDLNQKVSGVYFFVQFPVLLVLIIMGIVFQTFLNNRLNARLEVYFNNLFSINRRFEWFSNLKLDLGRQKDIRQFQMQDFIVKKIDICNENTGNIFAEMNRITCQTDLKVNFINSFVLYSGYCHNAICFFLRKVNIGEFLSLYYLMNEVYTVLGKIGEDLIQGKQLISYLLPIEQLFRYEEIKNDGIPLEHVESICFDHLYFRYPGEELWVLEDVNFIVQAGEKIGIVGANGAGKTTLTKLLCRFYKPVKGKILINGIDINEYSMESYLSKISAIFQDFKTFDFTVSDNVKMGKTVEDERFRECLRLSALAEKVDELKEKERTLLGVQTNHGAIEFSGGERQRLAIARAVCQNGDIYIFDEPNASLDPVVELQTYSKYNEITHNKIAFYISHRMTTTLFCSKILVLEKGCVTDYDSPQNLLQNKESLFYKLYMIQKESLGFDTHS